MEIKKVKESEIAEVKNVLSETWKDTYGKYYSENAIKKITAQWHDPKKLKKQALDEDVYFAATHIENKIVGVITARQSEDHKTIELYRLYVLPEYQGKRIGKKLLESLFDYFTEARNLRCECEKQNNKACTFYLHNGFEEVDSKIEEVEGVKMETVMFEKSLD